MVRRLGYRFAAFFRATVPDPFALAILLTLVAFGLAAVIEGAGPVSIVSAWQGDSGFWSLLRFGMQMTLILVTGHALASTPLLSRVIRWVSGRPRSGAQAAALVSAAAMTTAVLNWGLGLIVGALLAREVGRSCALRGIRAHYPLLAAAGYTGLLCWHGGFSGTAPLMMTRSRDVDRFLGEDLATRIEPIPFTETVLGGENLVVTGGLLLFVPLLCAALAPREGDPVETIDEYAPADDDAHDEDPPETLPDKLETSPWLAGAIVVPLLAAVLLWLREEGLSRLDPNALNLIFLTAGLGLHGSVRRYVRAVAEAVRGASGIVLQFPFYAGIMGVMRGTGLATTFAGALAATASPKLYATLTMLSAAVINFFVPSGGGQWAVQGPVAAAASHELQVPLERAVMAVAYGDQLTNMLQPFWALPLLAITGIRARDLVGYTAIVMLAAAVWFVGCLLLFAP